MGTVSTFLCNENISFSDLEDYFHRKKDTIHKSMVKMARENSWNTFTYYDNDKLFVSKKRINLDK